MSIIRHEIRKISDENRGQPIISQAVVHGNVGYFAGIADMRLFEDHNSVWNEWVDPANPPARACLTTDFWRPGMLVEVMVVAAVP